MPRSTTATGSSSAAAASTTAAATSSSAAAPAGSSSATAPRPASAFPKGMRNTAEAQSLSTDAYLRGYEDLPGHHLQSVRNLIGTTQDEEYPVSSEDLSDDGWDYSGLRDPEAFRQFQAAADYCFACSNKSTAGDFDPLRECFVVDIIQNDKTGGAGNPSAQGGPEMPRPKTTPPDNSERAAQIAQIRKLEAKLVEERRQLSALKATLEPGPSTRGERARIAGRIARNRMEADANGDPLTPERAS